MLGAEPTTAQTVAEKTTSRTRPAAARPFGVTDPPAAARTSDL